MLEIKLSNKQCVAVGAFKTITFMRKKTGVTIGPKNPPMSVIDKKIARLEKKLMVLRSKKNGKRPYTLNHKPSTCVLCEKTCLNQAGLTAHMRLRHKKSSSA